jgi:PAS domain-containing protein
MDKKSYTPPRVVDYPPGQVPEWMEQLFFIDLPSPIPSQRRVSPVCTTVIDSDRKYVQVSDSFCELLGYTSEELIGKTYDQVTAPESADIPTIFSLFKRLGYMQGLWLLIHRTGKRILIRYEAWVRPDSFIESNIEVVDQLH